MSLLGFKNLSRQSWMFIGLAIYSLSPLVKFYTPASIPYLVELMGFLVLSYSLLNGGFKHISGSDKTILKVFLIWSAFLIIRGDLTGNIKLGANNITQIISSFMFDEQSAMAFFIPLVVLMPFRLNMLYDFKRVGIILCAISLLWVLMNFDLVVASTAMEGMTELQMGTGEDATIRDASRAFLFANYLMVFLVFNYNYFSGLIKYVLPVLLFVSFFIQVLSGGRGGAILSAIYVILFIYITLRYPPVVNTNKKARIIYIRLFSIIALGVFVMLIRYMIQHNSFDFLIHRFEEGASDMGYLVASNREILRRDFISYFNEHPLYWFFGGGVNGIYATSVHALHGFRDTIEYGYLHFILKGGVPYLLMYVYLLLHSAWLGLFRSNNLLCNALAFYCIVNVIALYTTTGPQVNLRYFLVWISIMLLQNNMVRNLSDSRIYKYFNNRNYLSKED